MSHQTTFDTALESIGESINVANRESDKKNIENSAAIYFSSGSTLETAPGATVTDLGTLRTVAFSHQGKNFQLPLIGFASNSVTQIDNMTVDFALKDPVPFCRAGINKLATRYGSGDSAMKLSVTFKTETRTPLSDFTNINE
jgi:hypothetical protein